MTWWHEHLRGKVGELTGRARKQHNELGVVVEQQQGRVAVQAAARILGKEAAAARSIASNQKAERMETPPRPTIGMP